MPIDNPDVPSSAPIRADGFDGADARYLELVLAGEDFPRFVILAGGRLLKGDGTAYPTEDAWDPLLASGIAFTPNGSIAATNVQAAIQEVRDEAGGGSVDVLSNVASGVLIGRITSGSGDSEELSPTQTRELLDLVIGTDVQAWSAVLDATTASFTTADETKLDGIEAAADVTDATNVAAAGAVMESDYDANTILAANSDNTPAALTVAEQRIVGRKTGGSIDDLTGAEVGAILVPSMSTYTPVLTASGDDPAYTTAIVQGSYCQIGKMVQFWVTLYFAGFTDVGSGYYHVSVPVAASTSLFQACGVGYVSSPATAAWICSAFILPAGLGGFDDQLQLLLGEGRTVGAGDPDEVQVADGSPFAWSAGASIVVSGAYVAA